MHTLRFRSLKLILETDQAELARDIRFDFDKASKKLAKIRGRLMDKRPLCSISKHRFER
jgi:hypothetical protein